MTRRLVSCMCSREQAGLMEHELRRVGWRLVLADGLVHGGPSGARCEVFVWLCPFCSEQRNALLQSRSDS